MGSDNVDHLSAFMSGPRCPGAMARQAPARSLMLESSPWWVHPEKPSRHKIPHTPSRHFGDKVRISHPRSEDDMCQEPVGVHHHHHHHYHVSSSKARVAESENPSWYHHWAKATNSLSWAKATSSSSLVDKSHFKGKHKSEGMNDAGHRIDSGAINCLEMLPPMSKANAPDQASYSLPESASKSQMYHEFEDDISEADHLPQLNPQEVAKWLCSMPEQCKISLSVRKAIVSKVLRFQIHSGQFAEELRHPPDGALPFDLPDQRACVWLRREWRLLQQQRALAAAALTFNGRDDVDRWKALRVEKLRVMRISGGRLKEDEQEKPEGWGEPEEHEDHVDLSEDLHEDWYDQEHPGSQRTMSSHLGEPANADLEEWGEPHDLDDNYAAEEQDLHTAQYEEHSEDFHTQHSELEQDAQTAYYEEHSEDIHTQHGERHDDNDDELSEDMNEHHTKLPRGPGGGLFSLVQGAHTSLEVANAHADEQSDEQWEENDF
eukprot:gnl/MRDRNA2_/MRDRNA2_111047_c0_seq1.p1 gnl/MRDRNA2_/MRDRNA2_111047_c0~~gnl/MRDRNA2_/MRDRNA2_111047_c0_seq1.p1  ORF type:complete len:490 (+),score=108.07 gnl/MRDRNA2_/MRDRNA2_111047_c0_seq1:102-1571(+)